MKCTILFVSLLLLLCSCGEKHPADLKLIGGSFPNDKGEFVLGHGIPDRPWKSIISLGDCTGTIVHQRAILTAAHCVTDGRNRLVMERYEKDAVLTVQHRTGWPDKYDEYGTLLFDYRSTSYKATIAKTFVHHSYDYSLEESLHAQITADVALIVLREDLGIADEAILPIDFRPIGVGDKVIKGGYGCESLLRADTATSRRNRLKLGVGIVPKQSEAAGRALHPDLVSIKTLVPDFYILSRALMYSYGKNFEFDDLSVSEDEDDGVKTNPTLCPGDSGGGLFAFKARGDDSDKNELMLVGVNSRTRKLKDPLGVRFSAVDLHTRIDGEGPLDVKFWLLNLKRVLEGTKRFWFRGMAITRFSNTAARTRKNIKLAVKGKHWRTTDMVQIRFGGAGGKTCSWQVRGIAARTFERGTVILKTAPGKNMFFVPEGALIDQFEFDLEADQSLLEAKPETSDCFLSVYSRQVVAE